MGGGQLARLHLDVIDSIGSMDQPDETYRSRHAAAARARVVLFWALLLNSAMTILMCMSMPKPSKK
jgi:hypothetical protein